jgi:hypothetical protein
MAYSLTKLKAKSMELATSCTVLFEGAHSVGKSTAIKQLLGDSRFQHTVIDRGFASNYAFADLYRRQPIDLTKAVHDFFANPTACVVYLSLSVGSLQDEYVRSRADGLSYSDPEQGCVDNAKLDMLIRLALEEATLLGYGNKVLTLPARANALSSNKQRNQILDFVSKIANTGA